MRQQCVPRFGACLALGAIATAVVVASSAVAQRSGALPASPLTSAAPEKPPAGVAGSAFAAQVSGGAEQPAGGEKVFKQVCVLCHGDDGRGGDRGGAPLDAVADPALVISTVTDGRGSMPPLGDALTQEEIRAVAAYVVNELFK
jgi:mono/diheme cytochrome c family protein